MPELPDIVLLVESMNQALLGKSIIQTIVNQPKVLNRTIHSFRKNLRKRIFQRFSQRGKWVISELDADWILVFNLGMGGEIRIHWPVEMPNPNRERVILVFEDGSSLWIHFWWFGHVHLLRARELSKHRQISTLGIEPLSSEFTKEKLAQLLEGKRGRIKKYLLDQRFIAGIGNVYIQDILWNAGLHPKRKANSLTLMDIKRLHYAIQLVLTQGIRYGPGPGEQDVWGNRGKWKKQIGWPQVAYLTNEPCPNCRTPIEELKVGNTTSYICPQCQI